MDSRHKTIIHNSAVTGVIKIANIAISILSVPLLLKYLGQSDYGVWLTIGSIVSWVTLLDLGLGNGLQNIISKSLTQNDVKTVKMQIATTYATLGTVMLVICLLLIILIFVAKVLGLVNSMSFDSVFFVVIVISLSSLSAQLILKLALTVLFANQKTAQIDIVNFVITSVCFGLVFISYKLSLSISSLLSVSLINGLVPIIILTISTYYIFYIKYKELKPSLRDIDITKSKEIVVTGGYFFIFQLFGLVMYSTDNIIISKFLNSNMVVDYNISIKYFSLLNFPIGILIMPYWATVASAYHNKEFNWIKKSIKQLFILYGLVVVFGIMMLLAAPLVYGYWLNSKTVIISFGISFLTLIYTLLTSLCSISNTIVNSSGKLKLLSYTSVVLLVLNVPLSILFVKYLKIEGVLLANIICWFIFTFVSITQSYKLLDGSAKKIWNE